MNYNFKARSFSKTMLVFSMLSSISFAMYALPLSATEYYVNHSTGDNTNNCLSSNTPCKTISLGGDSAIAKSSTGDTIHIAAGTYNERVLSGTKSLTLIGEDVSNTIVDGTTSGLLIYGGVSFTVSNITFSDATDNNLDISEANTKLIARNIRVIDSDGYGVFASGGSIDFKNVEISGNGNQGIHLNPGVTTADLVNTTISGNTTAGIGTAAGPTLNITNTTISNNGKAGLTLNNTANIKNTIIANNNTDMVSTKECFGTSITSLGNNLSSDDSCSFDEASDLENTNPLLGVLSFNGAKTKTHALPSNSPALNTGTNTGCPIDDQRGIPRPQDGTCDIGAYELDNGELDPRGGFIIMKAQNNNVIVVPQ